MIHIPTWKQILILLTCAIGVVFAMPNIMSKSTLASLPGFLPKTQITLGLDLQGGAHLLLEVDVKTVVREQMAVTVDAVRTTLRKENIGYTNLKSQDLTVSFHLRDQGDKDKALSVLKTMDHDLTAEAAEEGVITLTMSEQAMRAREDRAVAQSIEIVRRRVDETGTAEPLIMRQGNDRILIQLPGLEDPTRIKNLLGQTAKLHFRMVDTTAEGGKAPPGSEILQTYKDERDQPRSYVVQKRVMVSGENLIDAQPSFDQYNRPVVSFKFDSLGARKFGEATRTNVNKPFAIVLDGKVISAPVINEPIMGGSGQISGNFSVQEAQDLALLMRAGALPAPLKVIEERTVGPGLGADSIASGEMATFVAIGVVALFMVLAYSLFGMIANIALIFNLVMLMGLMTFAGATLTLPGIAGIAITVGMAVDANVLIYERIKEELRHGKKTIAAVDAGYNRAMSTIMDSNITTLIGGALLYQFGTGPIRGFAVTLSFGIIISMFTAISLTRLLTVWYLKYNRPKVLAI